MKDPGALIHAGIGLGIGSLAGALFPWQVTAAVVVLNAVGWPLREAKQRIENDKEPWEFSTKNKWEAFPPGILGVVGAAVAYGVMQ